MVDFPLCLEVSFRPFLVWIPLGGSVQTLPNEFRQGISKSIWDVGKSHCWVISPFLIKLLHLRPQANDSSRGSSLSTKLIIPSNQPCKTSSGKDPWSTTSHLQNSIFHATNPIPITRLSNPPTPSHHQNNSRRLRVSPRLNFMLDMEKGFAITVMKDFNPVTDTNVNSICWIWNRNRPLRTTILWVYNYKLWP